MNFWDLIFDWLKAYFDWNKQIMLPGFENVSLFDFKVALFITGIVVSGLISVVPNAAYTLGEDASERRQRKKALKEKDKKLESHSPEADALNKANMMLFGDDD